MKGSDLLLPSAGTAAGFPGTPWWPSAGWAVTGGAPTEQAVLGIAAARPGPPGAAQSPGKKRRVSKNGREKEKLGWVAAGLQAR